MVCLLGTRWFGTRRGVRVNLGRIGGVGVANANARKFRKFWGELEFEGLADHIRKDWSNSLASSTRRDKVVGMGETPRSLTCKEGWILRRKANIFVCSFAPERLACVIHS